MAESTVPWEYQTPEGGNVSVTLDHFQCLAMAGGDASEQAAQDSRVLHQILVLMLFCSVVLVYSLQIFCASVVLGVRQR